MEAAWNRSVLRTINERLLLDRLRADGATSRAELARITGLTKPTVSTALSRLQAAALVREVGKQALPGRGRTPVLYEADPEAGYALGVHIGRRWIRVAVADLDGLILARRDEPNESEDAEGVVAAVAAAARRVAAESGVPAGRVLHTVAGGPGVIDPGTRAVRYADNLPGWGGAGVADRLQAELGTGLTLLNDADLAAVGEYSAGAAAGLRIFVYLLVGTGIGGGIVVDGKLFAGAHGAAGELGYLPWRAPAADTPDGRGRGLLEDAAAADAVVALAHAEGMSGAVTAEQVFDAARSGDERARAAVEAEAGRLAHAVAAIAAVIDPEAVVLGGGVGDNPDLLLPLVRAALERLTPLRPELVASTLGAGAVLHGAVAMAVDLTRDLVFEEWLSAQELAED